jgi:membrane-associated HD superfamily phosphohydrolase
MVATLARTSPVSSSFYKSRTRSPKAILTQSLFISLLAIFFLLILQFETVKINVKKCIFKKVGGEIFLRSELI